MSENSWLISADNDGLMWLSCGDNTDGGNKFATISNNLYTTLSSDNSDINKSLKFWETAIKCVPNSLPNILFHGYYITKPSTITEKDAERIAYNAAEHAITIIQERYDIDEITKNITWISQVVMDNITDYISTLLDTDYDCFSSEENTREDIIEQVCGMIDWDYIYDILEEYSHQPRTMSDMLHDVGMHESDFL